MRLCRSHVYVAYYRSARNRGNRGVKRREAGNLADGEERNCVSRSGGRSPGRVAVRGTARRFLGCGICCGSMSQLVPLELDGEAQQKVEELQGA